MNKFKKLTDDLAINKILLYKSKNKSERDFLRKQHLRIQKKIQEL